MESIFKKSFLDGFAVSNLTTTHIVVSLIVALLLSIYIFLIYRIVTKKVFYSKDFNISLVCVAIITTAIIITIQNSIVISLGMVGALSIVRFRTPIKNPLDLAFLFWSIAIGIVCGAGVFNCAFILCIIATIAIFALDKIPVVKVPMILIVNSSDINNEQEIVNKIKQYSKNYVIKSRNFTPSTLSLTIEITTKDDDKLIRDIINIKGITSANLLKHNGELTF